MSFNRPTLSELIARGQDDLNARLPGADSRLRQSALGVLVTVSMGGINGLYGYLDYLARQILPDTADAEHLERWAGVFGINRKAATLAAGQAVATGVNGSTIAAGTVLQGAGGLGYVVAADVSISAGQAVMTVVAQSAGAVGAAVTGARLAFVSPIAGVAANATVQAPGLAGGADEESDDLLRERLLARISQAPTGGARHDYVNWTLEVPEVTRAWIYPGWMGAGTVGVAFVTDTRPDPIPTVDDVEAVEDYLADRAPVTAEIVVFAPTPAPMNVSISGLSPNDAATRAAVEAELTDLLVREAQPGGTILLSHIREAISQAAGEADHVLVAPAANVGHDPGELAVLGAVTFL